MNDDEALGYVLGTLDAQQMEHAERAILDDAAFAEAVERARADVGDVSRGLQLVAEDAPTTSADRPSLWVRVVSIAAVIGLLGFGTAALLGDEPVRNQPPPPSQGMQVPGADELPNLARDAVAVVIGTVTNVQQGRVAPGEDAMEYAIATVKVSETLKGAPADTIAAFDYVYSGVTSVGQPGLWAHEGDHVLVFLASSKDTIHENVAPPHFQVLNGTAGRYFIRDGELADAKFTLAEVRAAL
jgi:hypothetical protein